MKKGVYYIIFTFTLIFLAACSNSKTTPKLLSDTDRIQVVCSMGNPAYGADSKIITDSAEINAFVDTFENATIGSKLKPENVGVGFPSYWRFYKGEDLVMEYAFMLSDDYAVFKDGNYYAFEIKEGTEKPFDLYERSSAKIIVVDLDGKEIQRPAN